MTNPDPQNPVPEPPPHPLRSADAMNEDDELWDLAEIEETRENSRSAANDSDTPAAWAALPTRENRRKSGLHLDISPKTPAREDGGALPIPVRRMEQEFGSLESPQDRPVPQPATMPRAQFSSVSTPQETLPDLGEVVAVSVAGTELPSPPAPEDSEIAQFAPARPRMKATEWISLGILVLILLVLGVGAYSWSIRLLPEQPPVWQQIEFPVKGTRIEIKNASTYWRAPVVEGADKDPIRRGTQLIPVIELELTGGPAAVRVIFRDEEGSSMGDPVLRAVPSSGRLVMASTAGFEDMGMYAAYRTGEIKPWSVEIAEAQSIDSPGSGYSLVLRMNISTEQR